MKDVPFVGADGDGLLMDLHHPAPRATHSPVVVIVHGYNDVGFQKMLGSRFKDMASTVAWCQRMAASGVVAVAYTNRQPEADARAVLHHLRQHADALGLDADRIALWACSGHGPVALSLLMSDRRLKAAALLYPYVMDLDGSTGVAEVQKTFKFANPCEGRSMADLPAVPMFLVRAGKDEMPRLNEALDRFVAAALASNLPLSLVNHADAPHAFDLKDDSGLTREIIERTLAFLRFHLEDPRD